MDPATATAIAKDLGAWALSAITAAALAWFLLKQILAANAARITAIEAALTEEKTRRQALEDRQFDVVLELAKDGHAIAKEYAAMLRSFPRCPQHDEHTPLPTPAHMVEPTAEDTQAVMAAVRAKHATGQGSKFNRTRSGEHRP